MAGSADITGKQYYALGIGHPANETTTEAVPNVYNELLSITATRPFLTSLGDSISAQDYPTTGSAIASLWTAGTSGPSSNVISPMFWTNTLCQGAFDLMGPVNETFQNTQGSQTSEVSFTNGVVGYSGGLITDFITNAVDQFIVKALANAGGRPIYTIISGGMNDFNNNDIAGYDSTVFTAMQVILTKLLDAGIKPICKVNEFTALGASGGTDTVTKRRNRASYAARMLNLASIDPRIIVADIDAAMTRYAQGMTYERMTRGSTGDNVHPNAIGAVIYGMAYRDALRGRVPFVPPYLRPDWAETLVTQSVNGTGATPGTNASGTFPTGFTGASYGTNTAVVGSNAVYGGGFGQFFVGSCTGAPVADRIGMDSTSPTITTTDVYQVHEHRFVARAEYINGLGPRVRGNGSDYLQVPFGSGTDIRSMTDAFNPNHCKMLEGNWLYFMSFPFQFPASSNGAVGNIGGGSTFTSASGALRTFTGFCGLIRLT